MFHQAQLTTGFEVNDPTVTSCLLPTVVAAVLMPDGMTDESEKLAHLVQARMHTYLKSCTLFPIENLEELKPMAGIQVLLNDIKKCPNEEAFSKMSEQDQRGVCGVCGCPNVRVWCVVCVGVRMCVCVCVCVLCVCVFVCVRVCF
jgi:hypothetical protein